MRHPAISRLSRAVPVLGLVTAVFAASPTVSAHASTLTFDFGLLGASTSAPSSGSACANNCVLPGAAEQYFTTGGVTVGAIGYNASDAIAYVTQKPGSYTSSGSETGLGESNTYSTSSDPNFEIEKTTWLLIDNTQALAAHYLSASIAIESMQTGEGANVYGYSGSTAALDPTKLTLLATVENPNSGTSATQSVVVPNNAGYLVVQATGATANPNVTVSEAVFNTQPVPEPTSIAILASGITGLGLLRRRSRLRQGRRGAGVRA